MGLIIGQVSLKLNCSEMAVRRKCTEQPVESRSYRTLGPIRASSCHKKRNHECQPHVAGSRQDNTTTTTQQHNNTTQQHNNTTTAPQQQHNNPTTQQHNNTTINNETTTTRHNNQQQPTQQPNNNQGDGAIRASCIFLDNTNDYSV